MGVKAAQWHTRHAELGDTAGKFVAYSNLGLVHKYGAGVMMWSLPCVASGLLSVGFFLVSVSRC